MSTRHKSEEHVTPWYCIIFFFFALSFRLICSMSFRVFGYVLISAKLMGNICIFLSVSLYYCFQIGKVANSKSFRLGDIDCFS